MSHPEATPIPPGGNACVPCYRAGTVVTAVFVVRGESVCQNHVLEQHPSGQKIITSGQVY